MSRWPGRFVSETAQRSKVRIARTMSKPAFGNLVSRVCRDQIHNRGVVIDTSPSEFTATVKAQLAFGIYESAEIRYIRKYLRGYGKVLELGASLGVTAAHILDVASRGAELVCVEANPNLLDTLRATTAAAAERTGAKVRTIYGAVPPDPAVRSQSVPLMLEGSHLGSHAVQAQESALDAQLRVPAVDLSDVVRGWHDYALVCDIEGAEAALILSGHPVLTGASRLVMELHETAYRKATVTVTELKNTLLDMGFAPIAENGRVIVMNGPAPADPVQKETVREESRG
jgi:FkbM family methyltransferase